MTTNISQAVHTTETISASTGTIASGGFWNSGTVGAINNVPSPGTTVSYDLMDIVINFGTANVTLGSSPSIAITLVDAVDGVNYVNPGTAAAQPANLTATQTFPLNSGAVVTGELELQDVRIRPYQFLTLIQNSTGTVLPTATITAVRKNQQMW